jgi:hypothetical protein
MSAQTAYQKKIKSTIYHSKASSVCSESVAIRYRKLADHLWSCAKKMSDF